MAAGNSTGMTRRQVLGAGLGLRAALLGGAPSVLAQIATPAATPAGAKSIDTLHGPVSIPANPQRIVSLHFPIAVAMLELDVIPVGRPTYLPAFPEGHPSGDDIPTIDEANGNLDLEKIISLKPDLIIGDDWLDPSQQNAPYRKLTAIAPTILFEWKSAAGNWEAEAAGTAEALGKTKELDAQRAAYDAQAEDVKKAYADTLKTFKWDVISGDGGNWYLYSANSSHGKVVAHAGITFAAAANQTDGFAEYSYEQFDLLKDFDALLISAPSTEILDVPTFKALPAVQAGHVFTSDYFFPSSYGLSTALLDDITKEPASLKG
ncbi:MAG: ABC transporter substrate-binding protein [Thermomicrobiales bacterium]